jgi:hypothetical protein
MKCANASKSHRKSGFRAGLTSSGPALRAYRVACGVAFEFSRRLFSPWSLVRLHGAHPVIPAGRGSKPASPRAGDSTTHNKE